MIFFSFFENLGFRGDSCDLFAYSMSSFAVLADSCRAMLAFSPSGRSKVLILRGGANGGGGGGGASTSSIVCSRARRCPCFVYGSKERASSRRQAVLASDAGAKEEVRNLRPFLRARNEEGQVSVPSPFFLDP